MRGGGDRYPPAVGVARVVGAFGRTLVGAGALVLLFVAYQLWGTGIREAQSQARLEDEFAELLEEARAGPSTAEPPTAAAPPPPPPVSQGRAVAHLSIPAIGLDKTVVEGVSLGDLKKGPGHYPETPLPGQAGNAAIAGHRTTYGAPFNRVDELVPGDEVFVETVQGRFRYVVHEQRIVEPTAVEILHDQDDDRLTLTACHPRYSAAQRIVVIALLDPGTEALPPAPRAPAEGVAATAPASPDLDGAPVAVWPAIALGVLCAAVALLAWFVGRRWRPWPSYGVALPFFLVSLFYFFEEFSRFLPANY